MRTLQRQVRRLNPRGGNVDFYVMNWGRSKLLGDVSVDVVRSKSDHGNLL